jgi:predicted LPLAT superfamily acyltransferase
MSRSWRGQGERGSAWLIRLIIWITLHLGHGTGRLLLHPITFYFLLFSARARSASRHYLQRVLPHPVRLRDIYRHYHSFSVTILDRIFFLTGRHHHFNIHIHGEELLQQVLQKGGCLLLGSHLGSFEVLRTLAIAKTDLPVKVLMYENNAEKINAALAPLNPAVAQTVIPIGRPESLFQVQETIAAKGLVGILGDRLSLEEKQVNCHFLGDNATFPAGPFLLAGILHTPVILFFGLYRGGKRYDIHFEILSQDITLGHGEERQRQLALWGQRYADRLEHYCRLAPYNWFNFYDFWAAIDE